ncbi:hypothetical protein HK099_004460 [Clydaea vesicula]|uniref:Ferrochelatase n=1 Tax=Clydaea vesicula TaxID=447962 RepID=A0AAD5XZL4_9FUNG|nr:hypothetical protein HK099_004460 [Clydaea vesicula]
MITSNFKWLYPRNKTLKIFKRLSSTSNATAILLLNMGGPANSDQVHSFLLNLFSDNDLIPLPFQKYLGPLIAKRRTPSIIQQYNEIGGGSPIRMWTEKQGEALVKILDKINPETAPHTPYVAFRYAPPLTAETLQQMKKDGIKRAVAFSLYPQYSCSTTGSSLNELSRQLKIVDPENSIKWSVIDRWHSHPSLAQAFANKITEKLSEYNEQDRQDVTILFSAHSLPMTVVNRGDPYPAEVAATVQKVMENLKFSNPYRLIWQSQVGPQPWLGPQTGTVIENYGKQGKKNLLIVPIAFVSDHIETLFEIDLEYGEVAHKHGISGFKRAESMNDDPMFIKALGNLSLQLCY